MKKVTGAKVTGAVVALTMCLNSVPSTALAESESPQGGDIKAVSETEGRTEEIVPENGAQAEETNAENGAQAEEGKPAEESKAEETQAEEIKEEKDAETPSADENSAQAEESKEEINQPTEEETQPAAETQTAQEGIVVQAEVNAEDAENAGVKVESGGVTKYYETLADVFTDTSLAGGSVVTVLKDESDVYDSHYIYTEQAGITLDLNGKNLGCNLYVGKVAESNGGVGKVTVIDNGGNGKCNIYVGTNGTLNFEPASAGTTGNIHYYGGNIELLGGSVTIGSTDINKSITDFLPDRYAYKSGNDWVAYATAKNMHMTASPYYVLSVVPCDHHDIVLNDIGTDYYCKYCNMEIPFTMTQGPTEEQLNIVYGNRVSENIDIIFVFSKVGVTVNYKIDNGDEKTETLSEHSINITTEEELWNLPAGTHTLTLSASYDGYTMPSKTYTFTVSQSESNIVIDSYSSAVTYFDRIQINGRVEATGTAASTNTNDISAYSGDNTFTSNYVELYDADGKTYGKFAVNVNGYFYASLSASELGAGKHKFGLKYTGNKNMADTKTADDAINIEIVKVKPTVTDWRGYPYGEKTYGDGSSINNPTRNGLVIKYGNFVDTNYTYYAYENIKFNYYSAIKQEDGTYVKANDTPLTEKPVNAGDYIVEAVFDATDGTEAATSEYGFTIGKSLMPYNDATPTATKDIFITDAERTYEVDLQTLFNDGSGIIENDTFALNSIEFKGGASVYFKEGKIENGKLKLTFTDYMQYLSNPQKWIFSIEADISSTNYNNIPIIVYINSVNKPVKGTIDVTMDNWTYGDAAKTPVYTLTEANPRKETVSYAKKDGTVLKAVPTDAGEYTVTVKAEYDDYVYTGSADFKIVPKDISSDNVKVEVILDHNTVEYDGTEKRVTIESVTVDGKPLDSKEYGILGGAGTNAGTYTITIIGNDIGAFTGEYIGNYTGEYNVDWNITPKPVTANLEITGADTYTYTGSEIKPTIIAKDGETVIPESEYMVSYANNKDAGTASIIVTDNDGGNYTVSGEKTFTIEQAKVTIKALDKTMRKGKAAPDLSNPVAGTDYEVTGLIDDDVLGGTVTLSYSSDLDTSKVGTVEIIPSVTGINPNYEAVCQNGTLQIRKRPSSSDGSTGGSAVSNPVETPSADNGKADPSEDGTKQTVVKMQINSRNLSVNDVVSEKDAVPVIRNDRTLVPIRFITESLGGKVAWNGITKTVTLTIDGKEIKMRIGKTLEKYGVAPVIIDGRTFVPVRFVADELGAAVVWDDATKIVTITK